MMRVKPRWCIKYRNSQWRIYDRDQWSCTFDTLPEAHTWATQSAVADVLYQAGGLTWLRRLLEIEDRERMCHL